jgi:dTDP-glucose 4,6-dehydratase
MGSSKSTTSLITGGAGFLGSHLADRLLAEGHRVIAVDNLTTGNLANLEHLAGNERFRFIKADVTEYLEIDEPLDFVFHFAAPSSPLDIHFIPALKAGALGTHNALGLAKLKKARFVLASSSDCYGDPLVQPQSEDYWGNVNPIGPCAVYDEAKRFAEAMTMAYHRFHHLDTAIARLFNTYGPRMPLRDGRPLSGFIAQALEGEPLVLPGNGEQSRCCCYVSDIIEGVFRLAHSRFHEPVNLGNPGEITLRRLAELILELSGSHSGIEIHPLPVDEPKLRQPDITRARKVLGWEPCVSLPEGLSKTFEAFRHGD